MIIYNVCVWVCVCMGVCVCVCVVLLWCWRNRDLILEEPPVMRVLMEDDSDRLESSDWSMFLRDRFASPDDVLREISFGDQPVAVSLFSRLHSCRETAGCLAGP